MAATAMALCGTGAGAQPLAMTEPASFPDSIFQQILPEPAAPPQYQPDPAPTEGATIPAELRRQVVAYPSREPPGTIVIDTPNTYLYYVLGGGQAIRYGIGVGRDGFTWSGVRRIDRKEEWPDWHPPAEMIARQPYLPRFMAGGPGNPLGARAMYLGGTLYRIHGTSQPESIGQRVSSGCIRMLNEDVIDLYKRASIGTKVVVLPDGPRRAPTTAAYRPEPVPQRTTQYVEPAPSPAASVPFFANRFGAPLSSGAQASRLY
jgi:lipoprotein-anchoring transpeptidase ErfK/SrfK